MKELDRIKDEVAKEWFDKNVPNYHLAKNWGNLEYVHRSVIFDEVCKRYAQLVGENALKEAAENATASDGGMTATVDKSSITNHKNVKLI